MSTINNVKITREYVIDHIHESKAFSKHVLEVTKKYIESINLPTNGTLYGFDFDSSTEFYTVNHVFEYNGEQKVSFYRIPINMLWETL